MKGDLSDGDSGSDIPSSSSSGGESSGNFSDDEEDLSETLMRRRHMDMVKANMKNQIRLHSLQARRDDEIDGADYARDLPNEDDNDDFYADILSDNEQDYDVDQNFRADGSSEEAAWREALLKQAHELCEEEEDGDDKDNMTHYDLFKQLRKNIKKQNQKNLQNHTQNNSSFQRASDILAAETAANISADEHQRDLTYNPRLEEEEEDYEPPTYTTPPQTAPPPPLPGYAVASSAHVTIGRSRKAKSSRMRKRNGEKSPKKSNSSGVDIRSSATITVTSPSSTTATTETVRPASIKKNKKIEANEELFSDADDVLTGIDSVLNDSKGVNTISEAGNATTQSDTDLDEHLGASGILEDSLRIGGTEDADVVRLSSEEDLPSMPLVQRIEDIVRKAVYNENRRRESSASDAADIAATVNKRVVNEIAQGIMCYWDSEQNGQMSQDGSTSETKSDSGNEAKRALDTILDMFIGYNLHDGDNILLMVEIITKQVIAIENRQMHQCQVRHVQFDPSGKPFGETDRNSDGVIYYTEGNDSDDSDSSPRSGTRSREDSDAMDENLMEVTYKAYHNGSDKSVNRVPMAGGESKGSASEILASNGLLDEVNALPSRFGTAADILKNNGLLDIVEALPSKFSDHEPDVASKGSSNDCNENSVENGAHAGADVGGNMLDVSGLLSDTSSVSTEENNSSTYHHYGDEEIQTYPLENEGNVCGGHGIINMDDFHEVDNNSCATNSTESTVQKSLPLSKSGSMNFPEYRDSSETGSESDMVGSGDGFDEELNSAVTPKKMRGVSNSLLEGEDLSDINDPNAPWNQPQSPLDRTFRKGVGGLGRIPNMSSLILANSNDQERNGTDGDLLSRTCTVNLRNMTAIPRGSHNPNLDYDENQTQPSFQTRASDSPRIISPSKLHQSPLSAAMRANLRVDTLHAKLSSPTALYMGYEPTPGDCDDSPKSFVSGEGERGEGTDIITMDDLPTHNNREQRDAFVDFDAFNTHILTHANDYAFNSKVGWHDAEQDEDAERVELESTEPTVRSARDIDGDDVPDASMRLRQMFTDHAARALDVAQGTSDVREAAAQAEGTVDFNKRGNLGQGGFIADSYLTSSPAVGVMLQSPSADGGGTPTLLVRDEKGRVARISPCTSLSASVDGSSVNFKDDIANDMDQNDGMVIAGSNETNVDETVASAAHHLLQKTQSMSRDDDRHAGCAPYLGVDHLEGGDVSEDIDPSGRTIHSNPNISPQFRKDSFLHSAMTESLRCVSDKYVSASNGMEHGKGGYTCVDPVTIQTEDPVPAPLIRKHHSPSRYTMGTTLLTLSPAKMQSSARFDDFDDSDLSSSEDSSDYEDEAEESDQKYKGDECLNLSPRPKRKSSDRKKQYLYRDGDQLSDESDYEELFNYHYSQDDDGQDSHQILSNTNAELISNMRQLYSNGVGASVAAGGTDWGVDTGSIDDSDSDHLDEEAEDEDLEYVPSLDRSDGTESEDSSEEDDTNAAVDNDTAVYTIPTSVSDDGLSTYSSSISRFQQYQLHSHPNSIAHENDSYRNLPDSLNGSDSDSDSSSGSDFDSELEPEHERSGAMDVTANSLANDSYYAFKHQLEEEYKEMHSPDTKRLQAGCKLELEKEVVGKETRTDVHPKVLQGKKVSKRSSFQNSSDVGMLAEDENTLMRDVYSKAVSKSEYSKLFGTKTGPKSTKPSRSCGNGSVQRKRSAAVERVNSTKQSKANLQQKSVERMSTSSASKKNKPETTNLKSNRATKPKGNVHPSSIVSGIKAKQPIPKQPTSTPRVKKTPTSEHVPIETPSPSFTSADYINQLSGGKSSPVPMESIPVDNIAYTGPEAQNPMTDVLMDACIKDLNCITKQGFAELRSFTNPSHVVLMTMEAVCVLLGVTPDWSMAKWLLTNNRLLLAIKNFDKDNIPKSRMNKVVRKYFNDPRFHPDYVGQHSVAAKAVCKWVRALVMYDNITKQQRRERAMHELLSSSVISIPAVGGEGSVQYIDYDDSLLNIVEDSDGADKTKGRSKSRGNEQAGVMKRRSKSPHSRPTSFIQRNIQSAGLTNSVLSKSTDSWKLKNSNSVSKKSQRASSADPSTRSGGLKSKKQGGKSVSSGRTVLSKSVDDSWISQASSNLKFMEKLTNNSYHSSPDRWKNQL